MWKNKVIWSEGAFLQTQHFQQQERYLESVIDQRNRSLHNFGWGFSELEIDRAALSHGRVLIRRASGIFPDGTPFIFPESDEPPPPLEVGIDTKDKVVYLSLPLERQGIASAILAEPTQATLHRFIGYVEDIPDSNEGFAGSAPVQLGKLNLRLLLEQEQAGAFTKVGVAKIIERKADGQIVLDPSYVPPLLAVSSSQFLSGWLNELSGLIHQRSEALAQRLTQPGRGGMAEVTDFLLLLIANRYDKLLSHTAALPVLHPERFYCLCVELAGELSSFSNERRLVRDFPAYNHDNLGATFQPVINQLRLALSLVLEQNALQIELHDRKYGVRVAMINDKQLLHSASFVLAVNAQLPGDAVRLRFPTQVKIGTIEKIRDLVNLQLQGIGLRPLPVAPRQIPYHAGFNYFELDKGNDLWRQLPTSGGMAMHIAGEFPGLELELWAIRN